MVMSLQDAIAVELGIRMRSAENREDVSVTTTAAICARADSSRLAMTITNFGAVAVIIRPNGIPTATIGIRLGPSGGSVSMNFRDDFSVVGKEWQAVTASSTADIYVLEELIEA